MHWKIHSRTRGKVKTYHGNLVLGRGSTSRIELQALLNLLLQDLTELGSGLIREVVDTGGNGTLVGEETRDTTLVLGTGATNERGVVQQTVLGGVTLGLQGTEKSLLGTENLDSGGGVLGQVGQATSVGDQTGTNDLSDQSSQVRSNNAHLGNQVLVQRLAVLGKADNALGESSDVLHVGFRDILTHAVLGGVNDVLGNTLVILNESGNVVEALVAEGLLVLDEQSNLGVTLVVADNLDQLGEVPRVPLTDTHSKSVDGLVELVEDSNGLDDVVVVTLDGELNLGTGVSVTQTKLSGVNITITELLQQLGEVETNTTEEILDNLTSIASLTVDEVEGGLDATRKTLVQKTQYNLLVLLARLGEVQFKEGNQGLRGDTLRDIVDFTKSLLVVSAGVLDEVLENKICGAQFVV